MRGQLGVVRDEGERVLAGGLDDVLVLEDVEELELRAPAVLRRAEDVALPPLREVEPGQLEAVGGRGDRVQPGRRRLGVAARDEEAEAGVAAPADPPAQLVQAARRRSGRRP